MFKLGDYYRCEFESKEHKKGDLVYIVDFSEREVQYHSGTYTYTSSLDEFYGNFKICPEASQIMREQIDKLLNEIDQFGDQQKHLELPNTSEVNEATTTDLVVQSSLRTKKQEMALAQSKMKKISGEIELKQKQVNDLLEEKKAIFELKLQQFQKISKILSESIWTINLYTGVGEEIKRLAAGVPCGPTEKVRIRQKLLYMDEECGLDAMNGGIDATAIDAFDKWIVQPAHLRQVLPEQKAVVALRVRHEKKDYGTDDLWTSAMLNKENMRTYFLIRNGENLYRIFAEITVHDVLFPRADMFDEFFNIEHKPGTIEYRDSMDKASAERRHFMRILLILQGLFDRTKVFHPFEGDKVNLLDRKEYNDIFEFIRDDEMLLSDGKIRFWDWLKKINDEITIGNRIMGVFSAYGNGFSDRDGRQERLTPKNTRLPDDLALHTIERRENDRFIFLFERDDTIYNRRTYEEYKPRVRASCWIAKHDRFILNFDAAAVEDMKFYLTSRLDRNDYVTLIPLLEKAIKIKEQEARAEAPFKKLLVGTLMTNNKISQDKAEKAIEVLVPWWKFKNRMHRALNSNDKKALTMINIEYALRERVAIDAKARASHVESIVSAIRKEEPNTIFVGHKKDNEYVSYSSLNQDTIFANEFLWKYNGNTGETRRAEIKAWKIIDRRWERWVCLYKADAWEKWSFNARPGDYLTDPERRVIFEEIWAYLKEEFGSGKDFHENKRRVLQLAITWDAEDKTYQFWYSGTYPDVDPEKPLTGTNSKPSLESYRLKDWKRKNDGAISKMMSHFNINHWSDQHCWREDRHGAVLWEETANIAQYDTEYARYETHSELHHRKRMYVYSLLGPLKEEMQKRLEEKEYAAFLDDDGHPELWPEHKKTLKFDIDIGTIDDRLELLSDLGYALEGMTVAAIIAESNAKKPKVKKKRDKNTWYNSDYYKGKDEEEAKQERETLEALPQDFALRVEPEEESTE